MFILTRWAVQMPRWVFLLVAAAAVCSGGADQQFANQRAQPIFHGRATIDRYCVSCHNTKAKMGGLALDADDVNQHPQNWEKGIRKLSARIMRPPGLPRPDERTYEALIASLETTLDTTASAHPDPGRTDTFRRLNRTEYHNAIRDLLAVDVDVASLLPSDESSHGFDNVTVGDLSPALLEKYLSAAQKVSRLAIGSPSRSPGGVIVNIPPDLTQEDHFDELPLGTRGGKVVTYTFPQDAEYEIQLRLQRDRNEHVEGLHQPDEVELMIDGVRVKTFTVTPPAQGVDHHAVDQGLNLRVPIKAGPHAIAVAFP